MRLIFSTSFENSPPLQEVINRACLLMSACTQEVCGASLAPRRMAPCGLLEYEQFVTPCHAAGLIFITPDQVCYALYCRSNRANSRVKSNMHKTASAQIVKKKNTTLPRGYGAL